MVHILGPMQPSPEINGKVVLITGGTGSFGKAFVRELLDHHGPAAVRIYSRDELKQFELANDWNDDRLRFLIGHVRDRTRLARGSQGAVVGGRGAGVMEQVVWNEEMHRSGAPGPINVIGIPNVAPAIISRDRASFSRRSPGCAPPRRVPETGGTIR